jgi:AhpD family alkylhydroperoxidase
MSQRLDYMQQSPELLGAYLKFSMAVGESAIDANLRELVNLRVSQINGCAFCLDMHVKQAKIRGESELRLHHVAIWRESELFSPRERAAFEWAELLTELPAHGVEDEAYATARAHFSEKELTDLTFAVMLINGWNRANVAFRTAPGAHDAAFGLDKARFA